MRPMVIANSPLIAGRIIGVDGKFLLIKITEGYLEVQSRYEYQSFNVKFFINRMTYQMLHNALMWFEEHALHSILISNPLYNEVAYNYSPSSEAHTYNFR